MNKIELQFPVNLALNESFRIARSRLPEILESISIVNHKERDETSHNSAEQVMDHWQVNINQALPGLVSYFLKFNDVDVRSKTLWNEKNRGVEFKVSAPDWENLLRHCEGTIQFNENSKQTDIKITCEFEITLSNVPGLPSYIANMLRNRLDTLVEGILSNYTGTIRSAIERIKDDR